MSKQQKKHHKNAEKITVYFDGSCPRCIRDRDYYQKLTQGYKHQIIWFDITGQEQKLLQLGITPSKALRELHIEMADGQIYSELAAYIELMRRVPLLKPLAFVIALPIIRPLLARCYHVMVAKRLKRAGRLPM
ncbi:MAG: DUF393 domain-containing protein [Psychrobium sp.]|nr:DUF393 domain-containing protein [Psychrobium sp.]